MTSCKVSRTTELSNLAMKQRWGKSQAGFWFRFRLATDHSVDRFYNNLSHLNSSLVLVLTGSKTTTHVLTGSGSLMTRELTGSGSLMTHELTGSGSLMPRGMAGSKMMTRGLTGSGSLMTRRLNRTAAACAHSAQPGSTESQHEEVS